MDEQVLYQKTIELQTEVTRLQARERELLAANNRMEQEARDARAVLRFVFPFFQPTMKNAPKASDCHGRILDHFCSTWSPTHMHRKGGYYRVLMRGVLERDQQEAVVYESSDGRIWIRPASEFDDGRFSSLVGGHTPIMQMRRGVP